MLLRTVDGRAGRAVSRCVARRARRVWSVCGVVVVCAACCGRPHRALRSYNQLTALPESFGQLTALRELKLSRASACAGCGVAVADSGR